MSGSRNRKPRARSPPCRTPGAPFNTEQEAESTVASMPHPWSALQQVSVPGASPPIEFPWSIGLHRPKHEDLLHKPKHCQLPDYRYAHFGHSPQTLPAVQAMQPVAANRALESRGVRQLVGWE
eukprot:CAMPEP_0177794440 /NCGR_PEP_ID=MMETSP0491_2-20121128/25654_1 /TAXON_ID=63592 /ORGANISM="Tetraselmis chuii, Strain PLY429" /LENGTH=122 /DNA_ID=CAMNT_0019317111 /DNA_START=445 /DNA_END=813 /DNA_ORIENTATION=+